MSLAISVDRFDYVSGAWFFWSEHHSGQWSEGYARMCRYQFDPGPCFNGWQSLSEAAQDIYRAWCVRESVPCDYDTVRYAIKEKSDLDSDDPCVKYFLEAYGDETIEDTGLRNYDRSDFVNCDMCYTRDLLNFYAENSDAVLYWVDQYADAAGYNSRLQCVEGQTIEDPDDFATALVDCGMTHLACEMLRIITGD